MNAKTIFLTNKNEAVLLQGKGHMDNYNLYMENNYKCFNFTEYVPIVLMEFNHSVIDLSDEYELGVVYLPKSMSQFQKDYFKSNREELKKYSLYLYGCSFEHPISYDELISVIDDKPIIEFNVPKEKKLDFKS